MFKTEDEVRQLLILATLAVFIFSGILFMFLLFYRHKKLIHAAEKKSIETQFLLERRIAETEIQETTLKNITREIHDNIGQKLAVARIYINRLEAAKAASGEKSELEQISELMGDAISDLHTIANTLNPEYITDLGLVRSLQNEAERINQLNIAACHLEITGDRQEVLSSQQELLLFRICQEFIQNSIKHAGCTEIHISLQFGDTHFAMQLQDNGRGFDSSAVLNGSRGSGLKNIRNRAKMLGSDIELISSQGTRLTLTLPIQDTQNG